MTITRAKKIVQQVQEDGGEAEIYEGYSGRCMYGETTTGVVVKYRDDVTSTRGLQWDDMGLSHICY